VGHAKSICLNFGLARDFGGVCHLRYDDTNPEKEEQEYVDAIAEAVRWLGFDWTAGGTPHLYYASDYFDFMYRAAEALVQDGLAYVDEQSADAMRANRGDFTRPGVDSPFRGRTPAENLARLREMRDGLHADGSMVLRARIDMASPNINLRDPTLYRIKRATHHNTGDRWCIYPMYTFAHPIEDALEGITHSICTLEFEDQRPFYDWLLENLARLGLLAHPLPKQYEFGRLNLSYVVTSKRKLRALVEEGIVDGWDDPRMPTVFGAATRRRRSAPWPTAPARARPTSGSTSRCSSSACATTSRARRRARWRCSTPCRWCWRTGPRSTGRPPMWKPAARPPTRSGPNWARATSAWATPSGSSATTSPRCRPRASSASSRATGYG
jgi:glutaminyl-tRNA synthetase